MTLFKKTIYLIRHGEIQSDGKRCLGITDVPLSEFGKTQAGRLGMWMARQLLHDPKPFHIYSSPIQRCLDTAGAMAKRRLSGSGSVQVCDDFHEVNMGEWENMRFSDIKMRYPKTYQKRGENFWDFKAPGGESFQEAGKRFIGGLREIALLPNAGNTEEICFVVAHVGVIRSALAYLGEIDPDRIMETMIPYASVTQLNTDVSDGNVNFDVRFIGSTPTAVPNDDEITELLDRYQVPAHIRRHMKGVANMVLDIAGILDPDGSIYDRELLYAAAMLHDFARIDRYHSTIGALKLRGEGYELVADIISEHDSLSLHKELSIRYKNQYYPSVEDLLYYADKRVLEETVVSLDERFASSRFKCRTPEARMNHQRRYEKAVRIEQDVFRSDQ